MATDPYAALIPEGIYQAQYLRCEKGRPYGVQRLFAWFKIVEPVVYSGTELVRFYNEPTIAVRAK